MADPLFESLIEEFLLEARERIGRVESLLLDLDAATEAQRSMMRDDARRELHTLKGNAAMMGFAEVQEVAHRVEDAVEGLDLTSFEVTATLAGVDELRSKLETVAEAEAEAEAETVRVAPAAEAEEVAPLGAQLSESVRVPFTALDSLVEQLQEMVIFRNRLHDTIESGLSRSHGEPRSDWDVAREAEEALHRVFERLQNDIMKLRLVPLKALFRHLRRVVHDESRAQDKVIVFETSGGDTPLDKILLEVANDALGHLVRNAVIHGIESPEERELHGKPSKGLVRLTARTIGDEVQLEVTDDGAGIDVEGLRRAAVEKGVAFSDTEAAERLVFAAGVSTREAADLSAGRGIGLSAVLESVERQAGRVEVESEPGAGSRFRMRLPLTVSVTQALLLEVDDVHYALPFSTVVESRTYDASEMQLLNERPVVRWREQLIPLIDLGHFFATTTTARADGELVVVDVEGQLRALLVDSIPASRDIVVKGLDSICGHPPGVSGSTILGDGRIILILDPARITTGEALGMETT